MSCQPSLSRAALHAAVLTAFALVLVTNVVGASEESTFERVFPSAYSDMLVNSKMDYEAKRYDEAFPQMQRAACAGDKESQWMLGHMYLLGQGVTRNDLEGYSWLKVAAEFQSQEYRSAVEQIEGVIDAKQLPAAKAAAEKFVVDYSVRATNMSCARSASRHGHIMDRITCTPRYEGTLVLLHRCLDDTGAAKVPHSPD